MGLIRSINLRDYLRVVVSYIVSWILAMTFWSFLRDYGVPPAEGAIAITIFDRLILLLIFSVVAGFFFGSVEIIFENNLIKRIPLRRLLLLGLILHIAIITIIFFIVYQYFLRFLNLEDVAFRDFVNNPTVKLLYFYSILVNFFITTVRQIDRLLGPGNLAKLLLGKFYRPRVEERIFMFLDLKSSTTIAEDLGHIKYSALLQDCFHDLAIVRDYGAKVYQYVGDEAVLSWQGVGDNNVVNSIKAFWRFKSEIESKKAYYLDVYGVVPQFKAGINSGVVTTAEVGELKREIAHHGDTINTAARIQSKCNDYNQLLLISGKLSQVIAGMTSFRISKMGEELLKGKNQPVEIFAVEELN